jgi:hypothetical protein
MKRGEVHEAVICVHCHNSYGTWLHGDGAFGGHDHTACRKPHRGWFYTPALARVRVDETTLGGRHAKRWTVLEWLS